MIPFAIPALLGNWWKLGVGVILGALLAWGPASCSGAKSERAKWEAVAAKALAASERLQRAADAERAALAIRDRERIAINRQEIDRALANIPDQALSPRQRERVAIELRRQAAASGSANPASGPLDPRR